MSLDIILQAVRVINVFYLNIQLSNRIIGCQEQQSEEEIE